MLNCDVDIQGGLYDSTTILRGKQKTEPRIVEFYELELFIEERGTSFVDGIPHTTRRGMLLCARPGQIRFSMLPVKCYFIRLFALGSQEADLLAHLPTITYLDEKSFNILCPLFFKLGNCYITKMRQQEKNLRVNSLFFDILYRISQNIVSTEADSLGIKNGNITVMKAKEYIDTNYSKKCTLTDIADHVHLSPNYLHSLFKKHLGISPYDYILEKKIDLSKRLILSGTYSLSNVALEAGFSSQSHFNKIFKKITGQTPADFRRGLTEEYL